MTDYDKLVKARAKLKLEIVDLKDQYERLSLQIQEKEKDLQKIEDLIKKAKPSKKN